ncbi:protein YIPF1-like [Arapaima gigas]
MVTSDDKRQEFEETAGLLFTSPDITTNNVLSTSIATAAGSVPVNLDMLEDKDDQEEQSELLGGSREGSKFWTFEYYQSLFSVDTEQVLNRVGVALLPLPGRNLIEHHIRKSPDLYGPFWICVTLVFSMAISGNLSTFFSQKGDPQYHYRPQFHQVSVAAVAVLAYAWLVPLCVWGFLKWRQGSKWQTEGYSFLETVCLYGYSLFLFIPTTVLWIIPLEWVRWLLILGAVWISGSVLIVTFWPVIHCDTKVAAFATSITIMLLHMLFAIGSKVKLQLNFTMITLDTTITSSIMQSQFLSGVFLSDSSAHGKSSPVLPSPFIQQDIGCQLSQDGLTKFETPSLTVFALNINLF